MHPTRLLPAACAVLLCGLGAAVALQPVPVRTPVRVPTAALSAAPAGTTAVRAAAPEQVPDPADAAPPAPVTSIDRTSRTAGREPQVTPAGSGTSTPGLQQRGERALASLAFPWQRLGYTVAFRPYTGGRLGTVSSRTRAITVFVKVRQDETELRTSIAHELGHALDFEHGSADRRAEFREVRGLPSGGRWFPCAGCDDLASPAGDYAEVFAAALVGVGDFRSRLAGPPSPDQLHRLGALLTFPAAPEPGSTGTAPGAGSEPAEEPGDGAPDGTPAPDEDDDLLPIGRRGVPV